MKRISLLLTSIIFPFLMYSQSCLPQGITFSTQAQVDNFQNNYPGCEEIAGSVSINGDSITNLNGLSVLTSIGGQLWINGTDALADLSGLDNLASIGQQLYINANTALVDLTGLNSLNSIGGTLYLGENSVLGSLSGLENLESLDGNLTIMNNSLLNDITALTQLEYIEGLLTIDNNDNMIDLEGLNNVSYVNGYVLIQQNDTMQNFAGLNSLEKIRGDVVIDRNYNLTSLTGLENLDTIFGMLSVQWNHQLTNMLGLNQLKFVRDEVFIWFNNGLEDLSGLESLTACYYLSLTRNTALVSLNGLENLDSLGHALTIWNNENLTSIEALENLSSPLDFLYVYGNLKLESLKGLDNIVDTALVRLQIEANHMLSDCAVQSICNYLSDPGGELDIGDNLAGCNNSAEILEACETMGVGKSSVVGRRSSVIVFPNPANSQLIISLPITSEIAHSEFEILNSNGALMQSGSFSGNPATLDISHLPEGLYLLRIENGKGQSTARFVKR